ELRLAAKEGDLAKVRKLLRQRPALLDAEATDDEGSRWGRGVTALSMAAEYGHDEIVILLLGKQPSDYSKCVALYLASAGGRVGAVRLLLDSGIPPNPADRFPRLKDGWCGWPPLHLAAANNHKD